MLPTRCSPGNEVRLSLQSLCVSLPRRLAIMERGVACPVTEIGLCAPNHDAYVRQKGVRVERFERNYCRVAE